MRRAAALLGLALAFCASAEPAGAANPVQAENALPGTTAWFAEQAPPPSIEGYTSELSLLPGETLHLHVSTSPAASAKTEPFSVAS